MRYKIFLIDDVKFNIDVLAEALKGEYDISFAMTGEEAVRCVHDEKPDLILLDIMMPGMGGFEICRYFKEQPDSKDIPVIFLTVLDSPEDKTAGFEAGAVDYIIKPFDITEIKARVKTHLELKSLRDVLEQRVRDRTLELELSNVRLKQEIAGHRRTMTALKAGEERYRLLTENVADGVFIVQNQHLVFVNPAYTAIFGYSERELVGKNPVFLYRQDYQEAFKEIYRLSENGERLVGQNRAAENFQAVCICRDSREIWTEERHSPIEWKDRPALLGTIRDITQRKLREIGIEKEAENLRSQNIRLLSSIGERYRLGSMVGKSPAIQHLYKFIVNAAASEADVILYGESGTGKELSARMIHDLSRRREYPFVAVNCGAVPEALFESEFFGYRKGAFTGAFTDKKGFFDLADSGTLFLDEVTQLTPAMQAKLLRVLQDREYIPLGTGKSRKADVRIISASNRKLKDEVLLGRMREDFFYRIHILSVTVPPLRERKDDIPLLTDHFFNSRGSALCYSALPGNIAQTLYHYQWPGNIRELQNALERYLATRQLNLTDVSDPEDMKKSPFASDTDCHFEKLRDAAKDFEKKFIIRMLEQNRWNRSRTAALLGISLKTLFRKMKAYRLNQS
jgi:PAS domain S-box-containing protein